MNVFLFKLVQKLCLIKFKKLSNELFYLLNVQRTHNNLLQSLVFIQRRRQQKLLKQEKLKRSLEKVFSTSGYLDIIELALMLITVSMKSCEISSYPSNNIHDDDIPQEYLSQLRGYLAEQTRTQVRGNTKNQGQVDVDAIHF